jgi:Putative adhesin Stv domain
MTTIVKGHGARVDDKKTFVPVGTTLKFYSDFDVNLGTTVALVAIANGAQGTPKETIVGTGVVGDIDNYKLYAQDDGFIAKWLAMGGESGIPIVWIGPGGPIGDGTRLCENPETCNGLGDHTCQGVLGHVQDKEIVILACRGYIKDKNSGAERQYGTDEDDPLHDISSDVGSFVDEILNLAKSDPDAAEKRVDSLPQGTVALMVNRVNYDTWQKARHLKDYAEAGDFDQMLGHLRANTARLSGIMGWLNDIPSYGSTVDRAVVSKMDTFAEAYDKAPSDDVLAALAKRPAIDVAVKALLSDWSPKDEDLDKATNKNRDNVKATADGDDVEVQSGGVLVLVGDGHDAEAVGYVQRQGNYEQGTVTVGKGGAFSKGKLEVAGVSKNQALVQTALEAISDKKISFG